MLKDLNVDQAHFIALLARAAPRSATHCLATWRKEILTEQRQDAANTTPPLSLGLTRFLPRIRRQQHFAKQLPRCRRRHARSYMH